MAKKKDVLVTMIFFDSEKKELLRKVAYTSPIIVPPKRSATFEVVVDGKLPIEGYKVSAEWSY